MTSILSTPRRRKFERVRFKRRARRAMRLAKQAWGHQFKMGMLNRSRYWEARRLMQQSEDWTLAQARVRQFLNELRRSA